jgi:uncharacterized protein (DUF58 family)
MFSVRRVSPRIVTVLAAAGLGLAALVALAAPAGAHAAAFTRDCGTVTVNLTNFAPSPGSDPNVVDVFRDGTKIDTIRFTAGSTTKTYDEVNTGTIAYEVDPDRCGRPVRLEPGHPAGTHRLHATVPGEGDVHVHLRRAGRQGHGHAVGRDPAVRPADGAAGLLPHAGRDC